MVSPARVRQNKRSYAGLIGALGGEPLIPSNSVAPSISGTARVGFTLTAANGTWAGRPGATFTRQWKKGGVVIPGATATTYVPAVGDIGAVITVTVTGTNTEGAASATSAGTAAVIAA